MNISDPVLASLHAVSDVMRDALEPWWVIASAAVALHGVPLITVSDIDVLLSVRDAQRILPTLGIELRHGETHPHFRSEIFGIWREAALPVEFMAGFYHRQETQWLSVQPQTRKRIKIQHSNIYIPRRQELQLLLERFGRPKDIERARLLAVLVNDSD